MHQNKPKFISLEGIEGVGKTTNMNYLAQQLEAKGVSFIRTREPGGTPIAESIRQILLHQSAEVEILLPKTEMLLLYAGRYQHVEQVIKPALANKQWVLCDRFFDATLAYQGGGRQQDIERILELNYWVLGDFKPDLTIILDAPVEQALTRIQKRKKLDRFETENIAFFERIRAQYLDLAKRERARFRIVDASLTLGAVHQQLDLILEELCDVSSR